jgi:hypothetical protein
MKLMAAAGLLICIALAMVGPALGGPEGTALTLSCAVLGLVLAARLLAPSSWEVGVASSAWAERAFLAKVVLWAFLVRAAVSLALHVTDWWQYLGADEGTFDDNGRVFYLFLRGDLPVSIGTHLGAHDEVAYPYLVGALYFAFGVSKFLPLLLNCVVGAALVYPIHALAGRFGGRAAARRAALLVAFFPSLVLWSALMVRDVWALLFIAGALFFADRLRRHLALRDLVGLVVCAGALSFFRSYIFFIVVVAIAAALLLGRRSVPKAVFTGCLVMVVLILALRMGAMNDALLDNADLGSIAKIRYLNSLGSTGAGSLGTVDISTPNAAMSYLPLGLLYFYCSPLPWQVSSPRQFLSLADLLLWYATLPAIVFGMAWLLRHRFRAVLPLLFSVIGISVLYALVEGNIGIIFRHRAQIVVPLCAAAGVGYAIKKRKARKESRALEDPVPVYAPAGGALRPAPGLQLHSRAP